MRSAVLLRACGVGLLCLASGCESLEEVLAALRRGHPPGGVETPAAPSLEQSDVIQVLSNGRLLRTANASLQVIDTRNPAQPVIEATYAVGGRVSELYQLGSHAILIANEVTGYAGAREDVPRAPGIAAVYSLDVRDPSHPVTVDQVGFERAIVGSRLLRRGGRADLYVMQDGDQQTTAGDGTRSRATLHHLAIDAGRLSGGDVLELPGDYGTLGGTAEALLVRVTDAEAQNVAIMTVEADADGSMLPGIRADVPNASQSVSDHFIDRGVLRVATVSDGVTNAAAITNFDSSSSPIGHCSLMDSLDRVLLHTPDRAFATTNGPPYRLRSLWFDADGGCREVGALPDAPSVNRQMRLIGPERVLAVGMDNASPGTMNFDLYDTSAAGADTPIIARAPTMLSPLVDVPDWERAWSVATDAVSTTAPDGSPETGLVMYAGTGYPWSSGVQLLTFSKQTLTTRGKFDDSTWTRRGFRLRGSIGASLSATHLSLFDFTDLDQPAQLSQLELSDSFIGAPWFFADYVVRRRYDTRASTSTLEVTRASDWPHATPQVTLDSAGGELIQIGDLLVEVAFSPPPHAAIRVLDMHDPSAPRVAGRLETDAISVYYGSHGLFAWNYYVLGQCLLISFPFTYDVVDFRDPDRPVVTFDNLTPTVPDGGWSAAPVVSETKLYVNALSYSTQDVPRQYLYAVDCSDPSAVVIGPHLDAPGPVVAASGSRLYSIGTASDGSYALWQLRDDGSSVAVVAEHRWPDRSAAYVQFDRAGHVLVTTKLLPNAAPPADPRSAWTRLEILAPDTLETLVEIPLDVSASDPFTSQDRVVYTLDGGWLVVDIADPTHPELHAYGSDTSVGQWNDEVVVIDAWRDWHR